MNINGIINLNKPSGPTSMDMVRFIKRLTNERKVGHGGTLDPIASGVLPIFLGNATRMMSYLIARNKTYVAKVRLGITTDSFDSAGSVIGTGDLSTINRLRVERVLASFRGVISQVPPMYSALKQSGERLYDLARAGEYVDRAPRQVEVFQLELREWVPPTMELYVECGRGVYVRSLAHDIGEVLGCGAHLEGLTRHCTGPFSLAESVTVEQLQEAVDQGSWDKYIQRMDLVVCHTRAAVVGNPAEIYILNGRPIALNLKGQSRAVDKELCRVYTCDGHFLALVHFDGSDGLWHPDRVFPPPLNFCNDQQMSLSPPSSGGRWEEVPLDI